MILTNLLEFKQLFWVIGIILYIPALIYTAYLFKIKWYKGLLMSLITLVIVALGAKVLYLIEQYKLVQEVGFTFEGFSLYGAIFFLPLANLINALIFKKDFFLVGNISIVPLLIMLLFYRIDCFRNGCCGGIFINGFQIPTQLLEITLCLTLILVYTYFIHYKKREDGLCFSSFFIVYGTFRFILEFFRERENLFSLISISHIWSIVSIIVGIVFVLFNMKIIKKDKKEN